MYFIYKVPLESTFKGNKKFIIILIIIIINIIIDVSIPVFQATDFIYLFIYFCGSTIIIIIIIIIIDVSLVVFQILFIYLVSW